MNSKSLRNALFALPVLGYLYYCYRYIADARIILDGKTYYSLFDDAMISMRYAYNLAHGHGLVWNIGERVEGFTNPLWVGVMALVHLFPIPITHTSLVIQIICALLLALNLFFVRKVVEHFTDSLPAMLAAVTFTAFYGPLNTWGLLGMEVSALAPILTAAVWMVISRDDEKFSPWVYILLGVGTLFRMDMVVPFIIFAGILFISQPQFRKQHLIWAIGTFMVFVGGQTLARFLYYGDVLPNTYYLKLYGFPLAYRLARGLYGFFHLMYYAGWPIFILPLGIFIFRRDWKSALLFFLFAGQVAYSIYVGGDAWEHKGGANRFISIAMPIYFVALAWVLDEIRKRIVQSLGGKTFSEVTSQTAYVVLSVCVLLSFNALLGDWKAIERWDLSREALFVGGNEQGIMAVLQLEKYTTPKAVIAVINAGTVPYYMPDYYFLDTFGKSDPVIAHGPVSSPMSFQDAMFLVPGNENIMRPGHMKWNYSYTIGERKPDMIVDIWPGTEQELEPYLQNYVKLRSIGGRKVYALKDSPNINWPEVLADN